MKLAAMYELPRARLLMLGSLLMILVLFGLDLRDLYYKLHMLGPYDTFSFRTAGYDSIQSKPIPRPNTTIEMLSNGSVTAASGWPSFYSRCETLYASGTETSRFFLTTLSENCEINLSHNTTRIVPQLIMTASIRVDSVVAVSCALLFTGRRPAICQESIVVGFNERYMLEEETPTNGEMAQPGSEQEAELLRLLQVVSFSYPISLVTCVEAFEIGLGEAGEFRSTVFGCASPNLFQSEWVGFAHKGVARFLVTKGWLTADVISFMNIRYGIRQNSIDIYDVSYAKDTGAMVLTSSSLVNFSSYGHLYALSVLIDMLLLVAHLLSTFEMLKWILLPQYLEMRGWMHDFEETSHDKITAPKSLHDKGFLHKIKSVMIKLGSTMDVADKYAEGFNNKTKAKPLVHAATDGGAIVFEEIKFYSFFSRSFYRNNHYVLLTTVTQVLSWVIILPNSVIWTWSDSVVQKLQGYLCSIKSWVLIASALNFVWDTVVKIDEKRAYQFVKGTYITNPEIIGVGAIVAVVKSTGIFSMSGTKYSFEHQRMYDFSSFSDGYLGYGNSWERSQDYVTTTSWAVTWIIYKPLVEIVLLSLLACAVYLTLKYAFFYVYEREGKDMLARLLGNPERPKGSAIHASDENGSDVSNTRSGQQSATTEYARLPLEEALGCPIRAISLVRNSLSMEIVKDGRTFIRPSCYLDFGVMLKNGQVETRVGFNDIFKSHLPIKEAVLSENQQTTSAPPVRTAPQIGVATIEDPNTSLRVNDGAQLTTTSLGGSLQTADSVDDEYVRLSKSSGSDSKLIAKSRLPPLDKMLVSHDDAERHGAIDS